MWKKGKTFLFEWWQDLVLVPTKVISSDKPCLFWFPLPMFICFVGLFVWFCFHFLGGGGKLVAREKKIKGEMTHLLLWYHPLFGITYFICYNVSSNISLTLTLTTYGRRIQTIPLHLTMVTKLWLYLELAIMENASKLSRNKPMFGPVVLEITCGIFHWNMYLSVTSILDCSQNQRVVSTTQTQSTRPTTPPYSSMIGLFVKLNKKRIYALVSSH